ncbi:MAG: hypothetical protein BWK80_63230 [Desulfobacteraceae bacterium IS3]|nr:MAG: hypothetical protein BWK80_63230 [Desulfobacteraceae bacterium IS3]
MENSHVNSNFTSIGGDAFEGYIGASGSGGGIYIDGGTLTLRSSSVNKNATAVDSFGECFGYRGRFGSGGSGGGIWASKVTFILESSIVNENSIGKSCGGSDGGSGGGIYATSSVKLTLIQTTVSKNIAGSGSITDGVEIGYGGSGGGIYSGGDVTIERSTISGNVAGNGAPAAPDGVLGNDGGFGGGICVKNAMLAMKNSTVSGNAAGDAGPSWSVRGGEGGSGGGIYATKLTLQNCTITDNVAGKAEVMGGGAGEGGGIYVVSGQFFQNNIIAGNSVDISAQHSDDCYGSFFSCGYNLIGDPTGCNSVEDPDGCSFIRYGYKELVGSDANPLNPSLAPLADYGGPTQTHALIKESQAVDTGICIFTTDQRGLPRPTDSYGWTVCDIGAYELIDKTPPESPTLMLSSDDDTGSNSSDQITKMSDMTITGTGKNASTVQLYRNGSQISGATGIVSDNTFFIDISLTEGIHSLTATQTSINGYTSAASSPLTITVDTAVPRPPVCSFHRTMTPVSATAITSHRKPRD